MYWAVVRSLGGALSEDRWGWFWPHWMLFSRENKPDWLPHWLPVFPPIMVLPWCFLSWCNYINYITLIDVISQGGPHQRLNQWGWSWNFSLPNCHLTKPYFLIRTQRKVFHYSNKNWQMHVLTDSIFVTFLFKSFLPILIGLYLFLLSCRSSLNILEGSLLLGLSAGQFVTYLFVFLIASDEQKHLLLMKSNLSSFL